MLRFPNTLRDAPLNMAAVQSLTRASFASEIYVARERIVLESSLKQGDFNGREIRAGHGPGGDRRTDEGRGGPRRTVRAQAQWAPVGVGRRIESMAII